MRNVSDGRFRPQVSQSREWFGTKCGLGPHLVDWLEKRLKEGALCRWLQKTRGYSVAFGISILEHIVCTLSLHSVFKFSILSPSGGPHQQGYLCWGLHQSQGCLLLIWCPAICLCHRWQPLTLMKCSTDILMGSPW
jgi:hypothetical protein